MDKDNKISPVVLSEIRILSGDKPIYKADDLYSYAEENNYKDLILYFKNGKILEYRNVTYCLVKRTPSKENSNNA